MISTTPLTAADATTGSFTVMGIQVTPKVDAAETNGQFSIIEEVVPPGLGVPPNISHRETRVFYVVSGEFSMQVGAITRHVTAGDALFVPAGAINSLVNTGSEPGTLLASFTPAGHEEFLHELSELVQGEPSEQEVADLFERYGVELAN